MPTENNTNSAQLNIEILETRTVPASFGVNRGLSLAVADVIPGFGPYEYITGTGPGRKAQVRVWDPAGTLKYTINPFGDFKGGVFVATGDVNNDGRADIICSTANGTTGRVRVYSFINNTLTALADFRPFGPNYTGGVQLAVGNVTGDRADEIVVGHMSGGSQIRVFSQAPGSNATRFFNTRTFPAFEAAYKGGVTLAVGNIDKTGNTPLDPYNYNYEEIIVGKAKESPLLSIFDAQAPTVTTRASYFAFDPNVPRPRGEAGIDVFAGSTDGVRGVEIYTVLRQTATVRIFDGQTGVPFGDFTIPYPITYTRSVNFAIFDRDDDFLGINLISDLHVVGAQGPYEQVPIVYPGKVNSPAGFNGSRPAP